MNAGTPIALMLLPLRRVRGMDERNRPAALRASGTTDSQIPNTQSKVKRNIDKHVVLLPSQSPGGFQGTIFRLFQSIVFVVWMAIQEERVGHRCAFLHPPP